MVYGWAGKQGAIVLLEAVRSNENITEEGIFYLKRKFSNVLKKLL